MLGDGLVASMMNDTPSPPRTRWYQSPIWALMAVVFSLPLLVSQLKQLRMVNEVEKWLPANDPGAEVLAWTQSHFEPENRFLLSWDSSSLADPRVLALAERLKPTDGPPRADDDPLLDIQEVITPYRVLTGMVSQGVPREDAVQRLNGLLVGPGMAKVRLTDAGRADRATVEQQLIDFARKELKLTLTIAPPLAAGQPVAAAEGVDVETPAADENETDEDRTYHPSDWQVPAHDFQLRAQFLQAGTPAAGKLIEYARSLEANGVPLVEDCFYVVGAPIALSVSVSEEGDIRLRDTVQAIREAAVEVGIPADELRMGGSPIGRIELNLASFKALWNVDYPWWQFHKRSPLALSALVGTLLSFLLLKSIRLSILVLFTAAYTSAVTVALIPATGQSLNTVLMVMPNLLLVVVMSGLIHVANYWRHAACSGEPDPVGTAVRNAMEPCLLAGVTTAIGLASLLTSVLLPVRQFGLFSAIGCLISLVMVLWVFPALLRIWPGQPVPLAPPDENAWHRFGLVLARHHRMISAICIGLYALSLWGMSWFRTETKVIRYFPPQSRIVQDYQFLEDNLAGIVGIDIVLRFPPEKSRVLEDEENETAEGAAGTTGLAAAPETVSLDLFQRMELVREVQERLQQIDGISGAMSLADFRNDLESRPEQVDFRYLRALQVAKRRIFETRQKDTREFVTHAQTPLSVEENGLPIRIEIGEEVWRIRAQCSVMTDRHYADFIEEIDSALRNDLKGYPGVDHLVTGMVPLFLRTQEALLESLINSFGVAFLTIGGVMMYQLRSVLGGALAMLPNILPIAMVFGGISYAGIPVDVGTAITASIAMGISVDSELHYVTWFRQSILQGRTRNEAVAHGLTHCGPAMWQSSVVIALALFMLMFTDLLMISRFGWLMTAIIGAAIVADLLYMPALLAGIMGRVIERTTRKRFASVMAPEPVSPEPSPEVVTTQ